MVRKNYSGDFDDMYDDTPLQQNMLTPVVACYGKLYQYFLDEEIKELAYYRNLVKTLSSATDNDIVEIIINTDGGSLDTAETIISAISESDALVRANIIGKAYSAGSLIAMACHEVVVGSLATMMVHQASYGIGGNHTNILDQSHFMERRLTNLYERCYKWFLTEKEMKAVKQGVELWMTSDEIISRFNRRSKALEKAAESETDVQDNDGE